MNDSSLVERMGEIHPRVPLLVTIPHSGEIIPKEAHWLKGQTRECLASDIDRYVDRIFQPISDKLSIPFVLTRVHRYAADLNRFPEDVDQDSVQGSTNTSGKFSSGFHWVRSTQGVQLMKEPISKELHEEIVRRYHDPFHEEIGRLIQDIKMSFPTSDRFHIELHSMPSQGTDAHSDQGKKRPEITLSDCEGRSCVRSFRNLIQKSLEKEGFEVVINWPYKGGRNTQRYGKPSIFHHVAQIEINRSLYMNESTHEPLNGMALRQFSDRLNGVFQDILQGLE